MLAEYLKQEANYTTTLNGAKTYRSTGTQCLDLFAKIGAMRNCAEKDIVKPFMRAYAENPDLAMKLLFYARDIRGGLGERRVFRLLLRWLANYYPESVRKNLPYVAEFGRYDDLLVLLNTPCEQDMATLVAGQLTKDLQGAIQGGEISLLAKWLPSVNAHNVKTVKAAKRMAKLLHMPQDEYRKMLSVLREKLKLTENSLRTKDYSFDYAAQPSLAMLKYRAAFQRNDGERYGQFLERAKKDASLLHTGTLTPANVLASLFERCGYGVWKLRSMSEQERTALDVTWQALEDYTGAENALAVIDGSGSMYCIENSGAIPPIAVATAMGIYYAEHNQGAFKNQFITFSESPQLVTIQGRDIAEKATYCMSYNEAANTNIQAVFELILATALKYQVPQEQLPTRLYLISDMEFDSCAEDADMTNFEYAKALYEANGYRLPEIVFWAVDAKTGQQPVTGNEQGVVLVSGQSSRIFDMLKNGCLDPVQFMLSVLNSERYEKITA